MPTLPLLKRNVGRYSLDLWRKAFQAFGAPEIPLPQRPPRKLTPIATVLERAGRDTTRVP